MNEKPEIGEVYKFKLSHLFRNTDDIYFITTDVFDEFHNPNFRGDGKIEGLLIKLTSDGRISILKDVFVYDFTNDYIVPSYEYVGKVKNFKLEDVLTLIRSDVNDGR